MTHGTRVWLTGLANAALGTFATAITLIVVAPENFNPFDKGVWWKLASVTVGLMMVNIALYLKVHPIPDPEKDTDAARASATIVANTIAHTDPGMSDQVKRGLKQSGEKP